MGAADGWKLKEEGGCGFKIFGSLHGHSDDVIRIWECSVCRLVAI